MARLNTRIPTESDECDGEVGEDGTELEPGLPLAEGDCTVTSVMLSFLALVFTTLNDLLYLLANSVF